MGGGRCAKKRGGEVTNTLRSLRFLRSYGLAARGARVSLSLSLPPSPHRHNPSSVRPPCPKCVAALNNPSSAVEQPQQWSS